MGDARRPLACVIGEIDLVRALGLAGVRSAVVGQPGNPACYSRFTDRVVPWVDPWTRPDELVARLLAFASGESSPLSLFYDGDWDLLLISRRRHELAQWFRFVVAEAELVEDLVDKARFQALSERLGLPVPQARSASPASGDQPGDLELGLPVVIKPLIRQHGTWQAIARAKAIHVEDRQSLDALWRRLEDAGVDVLVQEAIPGPESAIESYHVYRDGSGQVVGEFTGRKLRTHPRPFGYSTALVTTDAGDVAALGRELADELELTGVAKLDFKRDPQGRLRLLEVNPRFNLWHHLGARAGVNLPGLVYADLTGTRRPRTRSARPGVRWCSLAHDLQAAREVGISPLRWLGSMLRYEAKSGFAWDDPLPLPRAAFARLMSRKETSAPPATAERRGG